jgi:hypothetical protein
MVFQMRNIIRDQVGSLIQRCKNVLFEDMRIKFMHGLGMVMQFCENVTFRRCDMTPAEGRTVASTADFFHFSGCRGKIVLDGCHARGAHDDFLNVHGTHLRIVEADAENRSLVMRFMHNQTWGLQAFEIGDEVEYIHGKTLRPYGSAVVTSYERLNDTDIKLILDRALPDDIAVNSDVLENATWTADVHITDCNIDTVACRGILCTTRGDVVIENTRFYHLRQPALLIEDDCNFWFESGYTKNIVFRNNELIGCNYCGSYGQSTICFSPKVLDGESEEFVHENFVMTGNKFTEPCFGKHILRFEYLANAEITSNSFDAPYEISAHKSGNITDCNNTAAK